MRRGGFAYEMWKADMKRRAGYAATVLLVVAMMGLSWWAWQWRIASICATWSP